MREIKFRAWDKINKKIINWSRLLSGHNLRNVFMRPEMCGLVLQQCTGIKDKNGTDIYEGDIVKVTDEYNSTDFCDGGIGSICGMEDLLIWYIDGQVHNGLDDINQQYYIEIIGDIYSNPDLLEVGNEN